MTFWRRFGAVAVAEGWFLSGPPCSDAPVSADGAGAWREQPQQGSGTVPGMDSPGEQCQGLSVTQHRQVSPAAQSGSSALLLPIDSVQFPQFPCSIGFNRKGKRHVGL